MGLKFIPDTPLPTQQQVIDAISSYSRSVSLAHYFFINPPRQNSSQTYVTQFYQRSDWTPPHSVRVWSYNWLTRRDILYAIDHVVSQFPSRVNRDVRLLKKYRNHPDFRIIATDKNLGLAVIATEDYNNMVLQHLRDPHVYELQHNSTQEMIIETHLPRLRALVNTGKRVFSEIKGIDQFLNHAEERRSMPKFHCIAKVHKTPIVGRPIAGAVNWITTSVSELLSYELRYFTRRMPWVLKDSRQLVQQLENCPIQDNEILVSFDVVALYPSMDQQNTIEAIRNLPYPEDYPADKREWLVEATAFVLETSFVTFQDKIFKQTQGMPMGTNAAVELANIYVAHTIDTHWVVQKWIENGRVRHWKRYIDDIFCIIRGSIKSARQFLHMLNQLTENLQFTVVAHPNTLAILDLEMYRHNNCIKFRVFQKALNKYLYIPFHSQHPVHTKRGFIKGELLRYLRNSSQREDFELMRRLFYTRLRARGYPERFLAPIFHSVKFEQRFGILHVRWTQGNTDTRVIISVPFHRLFHTINLAGILRQNWSLLNLPANFRPMVAYRRNQSVSDLATRSD